MADRKGLAQLWFPSQHEGLVRTARIWRGWLKLVAMFLLAIMLRFAWIVLPRRVAQWLRWWHSEEVDRMKLGEEEKRLKGRFGRDIECRDDEDEFWREFWGTPDGKPPDTAENKYGDS